MPLYLSLCGQAFYSSLLVYLEKRSYRANSGAANPDQPGAGRDDAVRQEEERVHRLALNQPGGDAIIYRDLFHTYRGLIRSS